MVIAAKETRKPIGYMTIENGKIVYEGKCADIIWSDKRLFDYLPHDVEGMFVVGNCMSPDILAGDLLLISRSTSALDGGAVVIENPKGKCPVIQRYHENTSRRWVTSKHGERTLDDGWSVKAVCLLVARYPDEIVIEHDGQWIRVPIVGEATA